MADVDAVIVPVGGGGLISGIAFTLKSINPKIEIYGVESAGAACMSRSLDMGAIDTLSSVSTVADGIAVKQPGTLTYSFCKKYVDKIVTVTDDEICAAILALMEKHKLVTEGAGAASVAAAMFGKVDLKGKKTVCLLSGGNIDVNILSRVINRGLHMSGRIANITLELIDRPGQLKAVSGIIAAHGANLIAVLHERSNEDTDVNGCYLSLTLETRNHEHIQEIKKGLADEGFKIL